MLSAFLQRKLQQLHTSYQVHLRDGLELSLWDPGLARFLDCALNDKWVLCGPFHTKRGFGVLCFSRDVVDILGFWTRVHRLDHLKNLVGFALGLEEADPGV